MCQHKFPSGTGNLKTNDNEMKTNKRVFLRQQRHGLEAQVTHEIKIPQGTPVGRWPAATAERQYLPGGTL